MCRRYGFFFASFACLATSEEELTSSSPSLFSSTPSFFRPQLGLPHFSSTSPFSPPHNRPTTPPRRNPLSAPADSASAAQEEAQEEVTISTSTSAGRGMMSD